LTWKGATGDWTLGTNWSPAGPPGTLTWTGGTMTGAGTILAFININHYKEYSP
jgi:hypothetical protein